MSKLNNYPTGELTEVPVAAVQQIVTDLRQLHDMGRPDTDEDLEDRVDKYFEFCQHSAIRPRIESLCVALHISRVTLYNWCNGIGCSRKRQEAALNAKAFINACLEQMALSGKLSPPTAIFCLKNWAGYKDTISFDTELPRQILKPTQTVEQIEADIPIDIDD